MTFLQPLMLAGLALVSVPILIHLIMRQQPRHVRFPAFQFLKQRALTNRRKLRLRHLLLLLLRMLVLAALVLALSRPRVLSERLALAGDTPVAAILVIDTSPSMGYSIASSSRLDEAKRKAGELIDSLPEGSRFVIRPTHDPLTEWSASRSAARDRLSGLEIVAANRPVTDTLADAYRFLAKNGDAEQAERDPLPRFIYLFTDRTLASWDRSRHDDLLRLRQTAPEPKPIALLIDVGSDQPIDLAVVDMELPEQAVPANRPAEVRVAVQATAPDSERVFESELVVRFDNETTPERRAVKLRPGQASVITVTRPNLPVGFHAIEASLATPDGLPASNQRFATLEVRGPRQVLVIADEARSARIFRDAAEVVGRFQVDVKTVAAARTLTAEDLSAYQVIALLSVAQPAADAANDLWGRLAGYLSRGGHLLIAPGEDAVADDYNSPAAQAILPARLTAPEQTPDEHGLPWNWRRANFQHVLLAPFRDWSQQPDTEDYIGDPRGVFRWWRVMPTDANNTIISYVDPEEFAKDDTTDAPGPPALLERSVGRAAGAGRVLLTTTPLDDRRDARDRPPNDYLSTSSFYLVLVNRMLSYLAGDDEPVSLNHIVGQPVIVPLPATPRFPTYNLEGPGLSTANSVVTAEGSEVRLTPDRTAEAGNYSLIGGNNEWRSRFSCNIPASEWMLSKVAIDSIEAVLGPDTVLPAEAETPMNELIEGRFARPLDLFPLLMIALLVLLAVESLVANRFYRKPEPSEAAAPET